MKSDQRRQQWQDSPSPNPRYKGATPADVGRALLRKPVRHAEKKVSATPSSVNVKQSV